MTTCMSMANHRLETSEPVEEGSGNPLPGIVREVVSQHAEAASFLWLLRHAAVSRPHYSIAVRDHWGQISIFNTILAFASSLKASTA
jgi:hypothetical protein